MEIQKSEKKRTNIFFYIFQNEVTNFRQWEHVNKYLSGLQGLRHPKFNLFALKMPAPYLLQLFR